MRPLLAILLLALFPFASVQAETRSILFPIDGEYSFRNDFSEPRDGGARQHLGIDIIASKMTPLVAVADGTITFIAIPQASWGYAITLEDADGYSYRYLHINNDTPGTDDGAGGTQYAYAPGLYRGTQVKQGQLLGWVGDSGNAESTTAHLHFEMRDASRVAFNPYDSLYAASGGITSGKFAGLTTTAGPEATPEEEAKFIATRQLQEGLVDVQVGELHTRLKTLKYYTGEITETYTAVTREAVRKFQNVEGIPATGIADSITQKRLEERTKAIEPVPTVTSAKTSSEISQGSSGEAVKVVQQQLIALGYLKSTATGYFGPLTLEAVIAFQKAKGIDAIGIVGPKTKAALASADVSNATPVPPTPSPTTNTNSSFIFTKRLEVGVSNSEVKELQKLLSTLGYFKEEATGYFGNITKAAVIAFQKAEGIEPLGFVGPATRAALNAK
jgi:peptidoglycan hydrolase-like protein with peptidoglycan-binding domain